jgi:hypothetical protein
MTGYEGQRQVMAVSRSQDEDQQLGPTVDGHLHRVPDLTIAAVPSPTNRAGQLSTTWPTPPGSAGRLPGDLLRPGAARRHC